MSDRPPADITAEWTVHAQLTISRGANEAKQKHSERVPFDGNGNGDAEGAAAGEPASSAHGTGAQPTPVRVVYKWSSEDLKAASGCQRQTSCCASKKPVHSIGSGGRNRAASSEPTYRPQCRSTCNIVLTACTDLYPTLVCNGSDGGAEEESYNTTATCTVLPTTSNDQDFTASDETTKFLSVKDAFSQTSDPESKADTNKPHVTQHQQHQQQHRSRSRRAYDFRRATTDALTPLPSPNYLSPNVSFEEGATASPFWRPPSTHHSPVQIRQVSPSTVRTASPHSTAKSKANAPKAATAKKTPRTVHIDVYCTGSEADDYDDDHDRDRMDSFSADSLSPSTSLSSLDLATTSAQLHHSHHHYQQHHRGLSAAQHARNGQHRSRQPDDNNNNDDDEEAGSNSTPQTVFTAQQMRLHHSRRNSRQTLPRRIVNQQMQLKGAEPQPGQLRQFILDQANEKDEINVSKLMLFEKHMGEPAATKLSVAVDSLSPTTQQQQRRKFSFARYATTDTTAVVEPPTTPSELEYTGSTYPNSTCADPTWSSMASSSAAMFEDLESFGGGTGHMMMVPSSNLSTADSFEYESNVDRVRIRQMEQMWMDSTAAAAASGSGKGWRSPEKERKFMLQQKRKHEGAAPMTELTEDSEDSEEHNNRGKKTEEQQRNHRKAASMDVNRFYMRQNAVESEAPTTPLTPDEPAAAAQAPPLRRPPPRLVIPHGPRATGASTRFGERIESTRQRHFGPAKNPDCPCDHCRLHAAERQAKAKQVRGRALSMGDESMAAALRSTTFWASRLRLG